MLATQDRPPCVLHRLCMLWPATFLLTCSVHPLCCCSAVATAASSPCLAAAPMRATTAVRPTTTAVSSMKQQSAVQRHTQDPRAAFCTQSGVSHSPILGTLSLLHPTDRYASEENTGGDRLVLARAM